MAADAPPPAPAPTPASVGTWERTPFELLFERRTVFLRGTLDEPTAAAVVAQLLELDALAGDPIRLLIDASGSNAFAMFAVADTMAALAAPVDTACLGVAVGGAAVVLAAGTGTRRASPNARILLSQPVADASGTADDLEALANQLAAQRARMVELLAERTRQPAARVAADLEHDRWLSAEEALAYGLIDQVGPARST